jgi:HEAT repeat protein
MARGFAALGLGFTRSHAKNQDMIELMQREKDDQVKSAICVALGLSGDVSVIPILGKVITASGKKLERWYPEEVRSFAAVSLGRLKHKDGLNYLLAGTKSKMRDVRRACWLALGEIDCEGDTKLETLLVNTLIKGLKKERDNQAKGFILVSL